MKITAADRDRYFDRSWEGVVVELGDNPPVEISLSQSFWRSCTELRSAEVGRWYLKTNVAPWMRGAPPGIVLTPVEGNHFTARVLVRKPLVK